MLLQKKGLLSFFLCLHVSFCSLMFPFSRRFGPFLRHRQGGTHRVGHSLGVVPTASRLKASQLGALELST